MAKAQFLSLASAALLGAGLVLGTKYLTSLKRRKALRVLITGAAGELGERVQLRLQHRLSRCLHLKISFALYKL